MRTKLMDVIVGLFMLAGLLGLLVLAFKVSGLSNFGQNNYYTVYGNFDNIGGLKVRAPVSMAGVKIGDVTSITLNPQTFEAKVTMRINDKYKQIPQDTSANIFTQGLLGSNYVSLTPGFLQQNLKPGATIETTHSALILENLVGQLMYSLKNKGSSDDSDNQTKGSSSSDTDSKQ